MNFNLGWEILPHFSLFIAPARIFLLLFLAPNFALHSFLFISVARGGGSGSWWFDLFCLGILRSRFEEFFSPFCLGTMRGAASTLADETPRSIPLIIIITSDAFSPTQLVTRPPTPSPRHILPLLSAKKCLDAKQCRLERSKTSQKESFVIFH